MKYLTINLTYRITVSGDYKELSDDELLKFVRSIQDKFSDRIIETKLPGELDMEVGFDDDLSYYTD